MILKSITPQHFGPFVTETTLEIDPDVTVITGPNDTGKSFALRAIEILCTANNIDSHEVHRNRSGEFKGVWQDDSEVTCSALFEMTEAGIKQTNFPKKPKLKSIITVVRRMALQEGIVTDIKDGNSRTNTQMAFNTPPKLLKLPLATEVRQEIDLGKMNEAESELIRLGFGPSFNLDQHKAISQVDRSFRIIEAQAKLNSKLNDVFPTTMPLQFLLTEVAGKPELLGLGLIDQHQGFAPIGSRGSGVRKLLNVMGALLRLDPENGHSIVIYDEPETSLHADAQHMLRRLLENLGSNPNIQVIYTTHSPAMINTMRPHSVRIMERQRKNDKAISVFINQAYAKNFTHVRSSLGLNPADSLLYAPITLIAEGATEVICIPMMLEKLAAKGILDSVILERILSQAHVLDGQGSSFEYMCRLAKSQNATPVVFLDGDKQADISKVKIRHPEVSVISLDAGKEFEDLIPKAKYIQAVSEELEDDTGNVTEAKYLEWEQRTALKPSVAFSKRVERWLRDEFDKSLYKVLVMQRAIELCDTNEIETRPFRQIFDAMRQVSERL